MSGANASLIGMSFTIISESVTLPVEIKTGLGFKSRGDAIYKPLCDELPQLQLEEIRLFFDLVCATEDSLF